MTMLPFAFSDNHQERKVGGVEHMGVQGCHHWPGTKDTAANKFQGRFWAILYFTQVISNSEDLDELQQEEEDCKQESPCMVQL